MAELSPTGYIGGTEGTVERIQFRTTSIRLLHDGELVEVPNAELALAVGEAVILLHPTSLTLVGVSIGMVRG